MQNKKKKDKRLLKVEFYRKKYGFTQNEFAEILGIKQASYSAKVSGKTAFTLDQTKALQSVLNKKAMVEDGIFLSLDEIFLG